MSLRILIDHCFTLPAAKIELCNIIRTAISFVDFSSSLRRLIFLVRLGPINPEAKPIEAGLTRAERS